MGSGGKKIINLSESIIQKVTECHKNFACLTDSNKETCPVEQYLGKGLLFIIPTDEGYCSYKTSFGYSYICKCPARLEIFLHHEK